MNDEVHQKSQTPFWQSSCEEKKVITKDSFAHNPTALELRKGKFFVTNKTLNVADKEKIKL